MNTFNQSSVLHSNLPHQGGEPVHWPSVVHSLMLSPIMRPSPVHEYLTVVPGEKLTPSDQSEMALIRPATGKPGNPQSKKIVFKSFLILLLREILVAVQKPIQWNEQSKNKWNNLFMANEKVYKQRKGLLDCSIFDKEMTLALVYRWNSMHYQYYLLYNQDNRITNRLGIIYCAIYSFSPEQH